MKIFIFVFLATLFIILFFLIALFHPQTSIRTQNITSKISLPEGFKIEIFADNLGGSSISTPGPNPGPRMMLFKDNVLYVSVPNQGRVIALPDENRDNKPDKVINFMENLNKPHGLDFFNDSFYIAEENRIIKVKDVDKDLKADMNTLEVLTDLPSGGGHFTRTIKIINSFLFVSTGSSCNVCYETDERRAAISICDSEGKNCRVFARGLRNSVGFVYDNITKSIWATDNGRDLLGDDLPPDEINVIKDDKDYGWPICYGNKIHDTEFDKNVYVRDPCEDTEPSTVDLQAHSAPLGLAFNYGNNFPQDYYGNLFVAYHGSWNRKVPTGYKIVRIDTNTKTVTDFATGWLDRTNVLGRPVDIIFKDDGSMLVSDDNAGIIYRIYYQQ